MPPTLRRDSLCLDHYIEETFNRLGVALELCHQCKPIDPRLLDWLLAGADFAVQSLCQADRLGNEQRAKLLELLISLANLHEYLRHHSVQVTPTE